MNSANGGDILYHFKGDTSDLDKKTKDIGKNVKTTLNNIGNAMTVGVSIPLTAIATAGVKYNAELESYTANLTTLLGGNKKQAEELLNTLKETAKTTPYETSQLVKATQTMMSFGISADNAKKYLNQIGDISMGNSEKLAGLTLAFSQVQSAGRLTGQDLLQMINQGFNPLNIISKETGESMAELKERMAQGGVSAEEVAHAFEIATSKGGLFYKGMEKGAQTTEGKISTLKDSFKEATGSLTTALLPALTSIVEALTKVADWFNNLSDEGKNTILIIGGIVASIGPLIKIGLGIAKIVNAFKIFVGVIKSLQVITKLMTIAQAGLNLVMSLNPIGLIIIGIASLIAILVLLWNKCEWFRNGVMTIFNFLKLGITQLIEILKPIVQTIISIVQQVLTALSPIINFIKMLVINYIKFYINMTIAIIKGIITVIQAVINFAKSIPEKVRNFVNKIVSFFRELPSNMLNVGKNMMMGLWNGIAGLKDWVINKVKNMGKAILKGLKNVLGIHSPSTEFAMIGKFSVLGYTEQLDKMKNQLQEQVQDTFGISPSLTGAMNTHYSPNIVVNNNVSMETDPLGQTVSRIKTFSGGAKNDYNYGMGG